ncbi:uncharacterized protein VTP21DRAFT_9165 [Calcarisporiella thermophila]|uniref:uncharacterized protein n=1 Tax=Calcarisporiella thermophila TaxID=911321 RepID=UPI0037447A9D
MSDPAAAIFTAAAHNDVGYFSHLMQSIPPEDLNALRNEEGRTPLHIAAMENAVDVVNFLCRIPGVDKDSIDNDAETPLYHAAASGNPMVVEELLRAGANVNHPNKEGITPLIIAAYNNNAQVVGMLLDLGRANINHQDGTGKTALILGAYEGSMACVDRLLKYGADMNLTDQYGWTALMLAAYGGRMDVCRILMHHGADPRIRTGNGKDAVMLARDAGYHHVADMIANGGMTPRNRSPAPPYPYEGRQGIPMNTFNAAPSSDPFMAAGRVTRSLSSRRRTLMHRNRQSLLENGNPNLSHGRSPMNPGNAVARLGQRRGPGDNVSNLPPPPKYTWWTIFAQVVTCCFPNICLSACLKKKDSGNRQAWREKMACQPLIPIYPEEVAVKFGPNQPGMKLMIVRGQLYNTGVFFSAGFHREIAPLTDEDLNPIVSQLFGQDITPFFPANPRDSKCKYQPKDGLSPICNQKNDPRFHCHTSFDSRQKLAQLRTGAWIVYTWHNVTNRDFGRQLFVYGDKVYDVSKYLQLPDDQLFLGGPDPVKAIQVRDWIRDSLVSRDATKDILRNSDYIDIARCFDDYFLVGKLEGTTIGCFATNLVIIAEMVILSGITMIKFIGAVTFSWFFSWKLGKISKKPRPDDTLSYVLLLVTCYSEGESSLRTTLDSLALSDYSDNHKLLFVIADGKITGHGNSKPTPDICKDMMEMSSGEDPEPCSYVAIGDGSKRHNMAKVYTGYYNIKDRRVPIILVEKCGTPAEKSAPKPGNRGKRDSQLILMQWLSKITFNEQMTPLEFDLFEKVRGLMGVTPDRFEMVLMVDADTLVMPDSVSRMVAAMERDVEVMGLCGETRIANKSQSWVTMIQVFEYYISHHLGKAFESVFGGVTCLPGCFCMYRVKAPKNGGIIPILANPDIVEMYSSNVVDTLHQKNLLLLGEDRYLTTLMLRSFPKRKMIYVPKAICKTVVPDEFKVLLSQRRRWINSTIHNLMELILVPQLCGIFCCSMQFVVFLDLLGTVVMPASMLFLIYLAVMAGLGFNVLLPLIFIAAIFVLQAVLILFTTRKVIYILWMFVYILALPVWNFCLPVYAFWRFDDFSWGATRQIQGVDNGHGSGDDGEAFDPSNIPMKKWEQWMMIKREQKRANQLARSPNMYPQQHLPPPQHHGHYPGGRSPSPGRMMMRTPTGQRPMPPGMMAPPHAPSRAPSSISSGYYNHPRGPPSPRHFVASPEPF